jgi:hypothetical protein
MHFACPPLAPGARGPYLEIVEIHELDPLSDLDWTARIWSAVEALCPGASPFVRWPWVGAWLEVYGPQLRPSLLLGNDGGRTIGAALIGRRRIRRHGVFVVRQLYLNAAGEERDGVCTEFNQLLCPAPAQAAFREAVLAHLLRTRQFDELHLAGFLEEDMPAPLPPLSLREARRRPSYFMDLALLRQKKQAPLDALSANTRQQIRRSLRLYGDARLMAPRDRGHARALLAEMIDLHTAWWAGRGLPGAFGGWRLRTFLGRALDLAWDQDGRGGPQLLRLKDGDGEGRTVGIGCYFLDADTSYYYQSGFQPEDDAKRKPGLCLHLLAMERCLEQGLRRYDFMASNLRYKQSLSNGRRELVWAVLSPPRISLYVEDLLRRGAARARGLRDYLMSPARAALRRHASVS